MKLCEDVSEFESNWVKISSLLLNVTQMFAKFHSILLQTSILSKNGENQQIENAVNRVATPIQQSESDLGFELKLVTCPVSHAR